VVSKKQAIDEVFFVCKVEKLSIVLASMMGTGSLIFVVCVCHIQVNRL